MIAVLIAPMDAQATDYAAKRISGTACSWKSLAVSSGRLVTPSLAKIALVWSRTVWREIARSAAIASIGIRAAAAR